MNCCCRWHKLRKYKDCFSGRDACEWLTVNGVVQHQVSPPMLHSTVFMTSILLILYYYFASFLSGSSSSQPPAEQTLCLTRQQILTHILSLCAPLISVCDNLDTCQNEAEEIGMSLIQAGYFHEIKYNKVPHHVADVFLVLCWCPLYFGCLSSQLVSAFSVATPIQQKCTTISIQQLNDVLYCRTLLRQRTGTFSGIIHSQVHTAARTSPLCLASLLSPLSVSVDLFILMSIRLD